MAGKLWFTRDPSTPEEESCGCPQCRGQSFNDDILRVYTERGLELQPGEMVTPQIVMKAMKIVSNHLEEMCCNPCPLEALAGEVVYQNSRRKTRLSTLPLPTPIIQKMCKLVYFRTKKQHALKVDYTFMGFPGKALPMFLWSHVDWYLMISPAHPRNL